MKTSAILSTFISCVLTGVIFAQEPPNSTRITEQLWSEFSKEEQVTLLSKMPNLELVPSKSVGQIVSAQVVNRSTQDTNSGAILGSAIGQAAYIDRSFSGSGSNYSAMTHLGVGILGAILGSSLDQKGETRFVINYGVKTVDGEIISVHWNSASEFTRPLGQCVSVNSLEPISNLLCTETKAQLIKRLSALATAPTDALLMRESSGLMIKCLVPGIGIMTLEKNSCLQMEGKVEQ